MALTSVAGREEWLGKVEGYEVYDLDWNTYSTCKVGGIS